VPGSRTVAVALIYSDVGSFPVGRRSGSTSRAIMLLTRQDQPFICQLRRRPTVARLRPGHEANTLRMCCNTRFVVSGFSNQIDRRIASAFFRADVRNRPVHDAGSARPERARHCAVCLACDRLLALVSKNVSITWRNVCLPNGGEAAAWTSARALARSASRIRQAHAHLTRRELPTGEGPCTAFSGAPTVIAALPAILGCNPTPVAFTSPASAAPSFATCSICQF
jgi:hypothetical protein